MPQLQVALDWTPNTNHTGFYVAREKGFYQASDLQVQFLSPHTDGYKSTPGSRCRSGQSAFAVTPSESVISSHTQQDSGGAPPLQARELNDRCRKRHLELVEGHWNQAVSERKSTRSI